MIDIVCPGIPREHSPTHNEQMLYAHTQLLNLLGFVIGC